MREGPGQLEPLPLVSELERQQNTAREKMMRKLTAHAEALAEHEVEIALGTARDDDGKGPDFMVQHLAAKSIRQQIMGAPRQTVDQNIRSQSLRIEATYEIPAERVDPASQPERMDLPQPKAMLAAPREIPTIQTEQPAAAQVLKTWKPQSIEASLAMGVDDYGAPLPKEER